ncbi:hypothetical protein BJV77DRAFT_1067087 [Russula vinacea]|nr:hypothetical protein BJV77DRAFT_1067087 [Russula vinacea]
MLRRELYLISGFHINDLVWFAVLDRIEIRAIEKAGSKITGDVSSRSAEMDTYWRVASPTTAISPVLPLTIVVYDKYREDGVLTPQPPTAHWRLLLAL